MEENKAAASGRREEKMKKTNKGKIKKAFSSRQFKMGAFQTAVTVVVIICVVLLNLLIGKSNIIVDLSSDKKYSLTEDSKKLAKDLTDDVTIYRMYGEGESGDGDEIIKKVLDQYNGLGGKINLVSKDPVQYPKFASEYTDAEINNGDLIVVNEKTKKAKHVSVDDMIPPEYDYNTGNTSYNVLDVEGQVTAAIQAVTSANTKKLYCTKGHDETALSTSLSDIFVKSNMVVEDTRTDGKDGIPEDCDILLVNGPGYDFSDTDFKNIMTYLENGGKAIFLLNAAADDTSLKNYYKILSNYGLQVSDGIVLEAEGHYVGNPNVVEATLESNDITSGVSEDAKTIVLNSKGLILEKDVRSTLSTEQLLTSTKDSFARISSDESQTKTEGDLDGPFILGAAVTDQYKDKKTQIIVFGTHYIAANDFIADGRYGNRSIMLNGVSWLNGQETSTLVIPQRSLTETTVEVPESDRNFWSVVLVAIIPLAIMGFGFFIWYRRRRS